MTLIDPNDVIEFIDHDLNGVEDKLTAVRRLLVDMRDAPDIDEDVPDQYRAVYGPDADKLATYQVEGR